MLSLILHLCAVTRASGLARNAAAAAALSSDAAAVQRGTPGYEALLEKNWVGNVQFNSAAAIVPASLDELRTAIRAARAPVRVVGRGLDVVVAHGGLGRRRLPLLLSGCAPTPGGSVVLDRW